MQGRLSQRLNAEICRRRRKHGIEALKINDFLSKVMLKRNNEKRSGEAIGVRLSRESNQSVFPMTVKLAGARYTARNISLSTGVMTRR